MTLRAKVGELDRTHNQNSSKIIDKILTKRREREITAFPLPR